MFLPPEVCVTDSCVAVTSKRVFQSANVIAFLVNVALGLIHSIGISTSVYRSSGFVFRDASVILEAIGW